MESDPEFLDATTNSPKPGQVLANYRAVAEFVGGEDKSLIIDLLKNNPVGAEMAVQIMRGKIRATEGTAIICCREMAEDLRRGLSEKEVLEKPHKIQVEYGFYTDRENVPLDPHWSILPLVKVGAEGVEVISNVGQS